MRTSSFSNEIWSQSYGRMKQYLFSVNFGMKNETFNKSKRCLLSNTSKQNSQTFFLVWITEIFAMLWTSLLSLILKYFSSLIFRLSHYFISSTFIKKQFSWICIFVCSSLFFHLLQLSIKLNSLPPQLFSCFIPKLLDDVQPDDGL